jgi:titin
MMRKPSLGERILVQFIEEKQGKKGLGFQRSMSCFISEPAVIIEKAGSMTVTVGETCALECKVAGTPELSVEWYKDGKLLTSSQKHKFSFYNKISSLKILSVEKEDAGTYTFQVQNNVGKSSCTAVVDVSG